MLTSQNCGKYLTATYERERERCAQNKEAYSSADQAFYDISGQSPGMGDRELLTETFKTSNSPIDQKTSPTTMDIRDRPEVGY